VFCPSQFKLCYVIFIFYYVSELEIVFISFYGDFIDWGCFSCLSFASIVLYILNHERYISILFLLLVVLVAAQNGRYYMRKLDTFRYFEVPFLKVYHIFFMRSIPLAS